MDLENALEQVEHGLTEVFNDLVDGSGEMGAKYIARARVFNTAASAVTELRKEQFATLGNGEEQRLYGLTSMFTDAVDAALRERYEGKARKNGEAEILRLATDISDLAKQHKAQQAGLRAQ